MKLLTFFSLMLFALFPAVYADDAVAQPLEEAPAAQQNTTVNEQDQDQKLEDLLRSFELDVDQEDE
jgi:hypothetical protein